ncbi:hypothetical protein AAKU67_000024 [Oxalobacteraceae bacterium GrIS 2.11]
MTVRSIATVPRYAALLLIVGLVAQIIWQRNFPPAPPAAENLPPVPTLTALRLSSFGEPIAFSKAMLIYLQTFDNQPGVNKPFLKLDFGRLAAWLGLAVQLDPPAQYPLFLASEVYSETGDPAKQRLMLDFTYQQFFADPNHRWHALAIAALMTRHKLNDLPLAQKYAEALRLYATADNVPDWAKQMDIFMLEDMQQYGRARALLEALLRSGQVSEVHELRFLNERLASVKVKEANQSPLEARLHFYPGEALPDARGTGLVDLNAANRPHISN